MRTITQAYDDPLDLVWLHAAGRMRMRVERSPEVNASWSGVGSGAEDGAGVLTIGTPETLDPDDCLAQMVLHEVCHALVEGPESLAKLDWGLRNEPDAKAHEHACLRLQAALADRHGMRRFFAATTVFRAYYDRLPADPLQDSDDASEAPAIAMARAGWERVTQGPWAEAIEEALTRSAQIARAVRGVAGENSLWRV